MRRAVPPPTPTCRGARRLQISHRRRRSGHADPSTGIPEACRIRSSGAGAPRHLVATSPRAPPASTGNSRRRTRYAATPSTITPGEHLLFPLGSFALVVLALSPLPRSAHRTPARCAVRAALHRRQPPFQPRTASPSALVDCMRHARPFAPGRDPFGHLNRRSDQLRRPPSSAAARRGVSAAARVPKPSEPPI